MEIGWIQYYKAKCVWIFTDLLQWMSKLCSCRISSPGMNCSFSSKMSKKVCVLPGVSPKGIPKSVHCKKSWWASTVANSRQKWQVNISSNIYLAQLDCIHAVIETKRLSKKNYIVFYHYNVHQHVEHCVIESISNKGWELFPHLPQMYLQTFTSINHWQIDLHTMFTITW